MNAFLTFLFGCAHKRYSWPFLDRKQMDTYVCCLDCGKRIPYDCERMEKAA